MKNSTLKYPTKGKSSTFPKLGSLRYSAIYPEVTQREIFNNHEVCQREIFNKNHHNTSWTISRFRFLWYVMIGALLWYFIPGVVCPALSTFAFITWIFPRNVLVNQIFGTTTGMALLPITFDWSQVTGYLGSSLGSPLTTPWSAGLNVLIGFVLWEWIVSPILHFSNVWEGLYFPFSSYFPN